MRRVGPVGFGLFLVVGVIAWVQRHSPSKGEDMRQQDSNRESWSETEQAEAERRSAEWREQMSPEGRAREQAEREASARNQRLYDERSRRLLTDFPLQAEYREAVYVEVPPQSSSGMLQLGPPPPHPKGQSALLLTNSVTGERLSVVYWGGPEAGNSLLLEMPGHEPLRASLKQLLSVAPKTPAFELTRPWPVDAMVSLSRFMNAPNLPPTFWDHSRRTVTLYRFKDEYWYADGRPDFVKARTEFMESKGL